MDATLTVNGSPISALRDMKNAFAPSERQRRSRQAAEAFRAKLVEHLWAGAMSFSASKVAIEKWPCFGNISDTIKKYADAIVVEDDKDGCRVVVDSGRLLASGLPFDLPRLLEHGHPDGVPQISHWNRTEQEMTGTGQVDAILRKGLA